MIACTCFLWISHAPAIQNAKHNIIVLGEMAELSLTAENNKGDGETEFSVGD